MAQMAEAQPASSADTDQDGGAPLETKRRAVTFKHMRQPDLSMHHAAPQTAGGGLRWQVYVLAAFLVGRWLWRKYKGDDERGLEGEEEEEEEADEEEEEEDEDDGFDMSQTMNHRRD